MEYLLIFASLAILETKTFQINVRKCNTNKIINDGAHSQGGFTYCRHEDSWAGATMPELKVSMVLGWLAPAGGAACEV